VDVNASDGTPLSVRVTGDGPPLVLVHGTMASKADWAQVEPLLAARHTVWAYDRRGRGGSGDANDYSFELEVEDVRTVVAAAGPGAHLAGHSFGAYCCLDAAVGLHDLRSLVLYEAPIHVTRRSEAVARAMQHLHQGDDAGAVAIFLPEVAGLSAEEMLGLHSLPDLWQRFVAAAPTCGREMMALVDRAWDATRYQAIEVPTLYISGSDTDSPVYLTHQELLAGIPHAEHAVLRGQRHIGFATDPPSFAETVLSFTSTR
jgi:pimeloyl-ACP methyl ester carboxylesterase